MRTVEIEAIFNEDVEKVYEIVTNNKNFQWRKDVENLVCIDDKHFVEYYQNGNSTEFIITKKRRNREYAFDMENKIFDGEWLGKFYPQENGMTKIVFTEFIHIKNPFHLLLSYFIMNPKKLQKKYISNLKEELAR